MNRLAKIGLFVTITVIGVTIYMMKTVEMFGMGDTYKLYALLDDASGLLMDSKILIAGVAVGKLGKIDLEKGKARVTLEIEKNVKIYKDALLEKKMKSMLGESVIYVTAGSDLEHPLGDGDYITNVISKTGITAAMDKAEEVANNANKILENVNKFIEKDGFQKKLDDTIDFLMKSSKISAKNLEANLVLLRYTLKNMAEITDKVNRNTDKNIDNFGKLLENTIALTERVNKLMGENDKNITESLSSVRESLQSLSKQLDMSKNTLKNVEEITGKINNGQGNVGKILNDEKLYNNLSNIMDKASDYADTTLGMQVKVDFHSEYMIRNGAFKSYLDLKLQPRKDRYYMLGIVDDPAGRLTDTTTTTEITEVNHTDGTTTSKTITEKERVKDDKLKLNLELARVFGPVTIRGGIIESTGGAGIDYKPVNFVSISTEIFDFHSDVNPAWRAYGQIYPLQWWSMEPFNWFYINGGVDDILNNASRDYFFGAGITFTDNDLKSIMGSASGAAGLAK